LPLNELYGILKTEKPWAELEGKLMTKGVLIDSNVLLSIQKVTPQL